MRTGRTSCLATRQAQHLRDPLLKDYQFETIYRTDVYAEQRGLEQLLHDQYAHPLNYINPISSSNQNFDFYVISGLEYLEQTGQ